MASQQAEKERAKQQKAAEKRRADADAARPGRAGYALCTNQLLLSHQ